MYYYGSHIWDYALLLRTGAFTTSQNTIVLEIYTSINYANWPILETFKLYVTFNYVILLPERFYLYDTESMKGARQGKKKKNRGSRTPGRVQRTIEA